MASYYFIYSSFGPNNHKILKARGLYISLFMNDEDDSCISNLESCIKKFPSLSSVNGYIGPFDTVADLRSLIHEFSLDRKGDLFYLSSAEEVNHIMEEISSVTQLKENLGNIFEKIEVVQKADKKSKLLSKLFK